MNRGQLRKEIRMMINDVDLSATYGTGTSPIWSDDALNDRLNLAHEKIVDETGCVETRFTMDITSGTAEYSLPNEFLYVTQCLYKNTDNVYIQIDQISEKELNMYYGEWRKETGSTPSKYYIRRQKLGLYPYPNFNKTDGLRIDCVRRPDAFASDDSIPFQEIAQLYPFHRLLAQLVAFWCLTDKRETIPADMIFKDYMINLRNMKSRISERFEDRRILNAYEYPYRLNPRRTR